MLLKALSITFTSICSCLFYEKLVNNENFVYSTLIFYQIEEKKEYLYICKLNLGSNQPQITSFLYEINLSFLKMFTKDIFLTRIIQLILQNGT